MDYCSRKVNQKQSSVTLMLTGVVTPTNANLQLATCSRLVVRTAITWQSKKQSCVALSSTEAEYIALAGEAQEATWL